MERIFKSQSGESYQLSSFLDMPKISPFEKLMIKSFLDGKVFSEMNEVEQRWLCDNLLFHISAMVGKKPPELEKTAEVLSDMIVKLFINHSGYRRMTEAESLLAIQLSVPNSFGIPDYYEVSCIEFTGDFINVAFIAKCFAQYWKLRYSLYCKINNQLESLKYGGR